MIYFDERDVVRHSLVQRIIKAYDEYPGTAKRPLCQRRAAAAVAREDRRAATDFVSSTR